MGTDRPLEEVRVPPDQYRENLRKIQAIFREHNVPTVFITAPTTHYKQGVPNYLEEKGFVADKESVIDMHKMYNAIVREIGFADGSYVLDLEKEFNAISGEKLRQWFWSDGIHLNEVGQAVVAKRIAEFIETKIQIRPATNRQHDNIY